MRKHQFGVERGTPQSAETDPLIVGSGSAMESVLTLAQRLAAGDAKVFITGESGVGKDLIARYIHARSPRAAHPFVAVNCAALTETLLESELFGHAKGSFTGAYRDKIGKLELADQGTIFLDEVAEMSIRMQVTLLRFLENGEIQPVGAVKPVTRVNARIIAATNRNLSELVASGVFREDLLYRIQVGHIHVPALRQHPEDIRALVELTIDRTGRPVRVSEEAMAALTSYRWPGNVRELQNVVEQAIWTSAGDVIELNELPAALQTSDLRATSVPERRRQLADDLYAGLVAGTFSFWNQIHELFLSRDITRHDIRELLRHGLTTTYGSYGALVTLFGMEAKDYKRFLNFLAAHDCSIDARPYRQRKPPGWAPPKLRAPLSVPLAASAGSDHQTRSS